MIPKQSIQSTSTPVKKPEFIRIYGRDQTGQVRRAGTVSGNAASRFCKNMEEEALGRGASEMRDQDAGLYEDPFVNFFSQQKVIVWMNALSQQPVGLKRAQSDQSAVLARLETTAHNMVIPFSARGPGMRNMLCKKVTERVLDFEDLVMMTEKFDLDGALFKAMLRKEVEQKLSPASNPAMEKIEECQKKTGWKKAVEWAEDWVMAKRNGVQA